jgi:hypothetical protein
MRFTQRLSLNLKALAELGIGQIWLYTRYRLGLYSGYYRWLTRGGQLQDGLPPRALHFETGLVLPNQEKLASILGEKGRARLLEEADELVDGKVRLFGGAPVPLRLELEKPLFHWTAYNLDNNISAGRDVKFIWEPGRFGWAYILGRAYYLTKVEDYADAFWNYTDAFVKSNPPYVGLHWVSAQEVALRLIAFVFAATVFATSEHTTAKRMSTLAEAIGDHANRIPPTLVYARAQNNNHLLTEAVGLYTAGVVLPNHPKAGNWREIGWRWLNFALQTQIASDGTYIQQSTNYHRLMLQAALWVSAISRKTGRQLPQSSLQKLAASTHWLLALVDTGTGQVPNLGPNDGAYIMPLAVAPFHDYRPVLQSAALAYLNERPFSPGVWDEMGMWFGLSDSGTMKQLPLLDRQVGTPYVLRNTNQKSWAYLRAGHFDSRPGHADQLHLDLWWRGLNLAMDAGTYLYNAPPPWDNSLARTAVHNTITVDGADQMTRGGRFLWLDWAQAEVISFDREKDGSWKRLVVQHNGYRRLSVTHQRVVEVGLNGLWSIEDHLLPEKYVFDHLSELDEQISASRREVYYLRLHWLLPDWDWKVGISDFSTTIHLNSPYGWITLTIGEKIAHQISTLSSSKLQVVRAGELLFGNGPVSPERGWFSPTYGSKLPALSLSLAVRRTLPHVLHSEWRFPDG